jgi:hypothetical protein
MDHFVTETGGKIHCVPIKSVMLTTVLCQGHQMHPTKYSERFALHFSGEPLRTIFFSQNDSFFDGLWFLKGFWHPHLGQRSRWTIGACISPIMNDLFHIVWMRKQTIKQRKMYFFGTNKTSTLANATFCLLFMHPFVGNACFIDNRDNMPPLTGGNSTREN